MPMLEVRGLTVGYANPLLRDVSFCAEKGQVVGVLGRNGCGKSTLLKGIAGSVRRFGGDAAVDGESLLHMSVRAQAARIAVLPQQTDAPEGLTGRDMIALGRYPYGRWLQGSSAADEEIILRSARMLGVTPLLQTDCARMSQGQRQLVMLSRCIAQDAPVLLLDEPNAALDYDNEIRLFTVIRRLAKERGKTVLMVLHDPETALRFCDRLLMIGGGGICAQADDPSDAAAAQRALRTIYPNITVHKDAFDGSLRCCEST